MRQDVNVTVNDRFAVAMYLEMLRRRRALRVAARYIALVETPWRATREPDIGPAFILAVLAFIVTAIVLALLTVLPAVCTCAA